MEDTDTFSVYPIIIYYSEAHDVFYHSAVHSHGFPVFCEVIYSSSHSLCYFTVLQITNTDPPRLTILLGSSNEG